MKKRFLVCFLFLTLFAAAAGYSDNIRGDVVKNITLFDSSKQGDNAFSMSIEDVFAVSFDKNAEFIKGIEIEVKVPSLLRNYSNSFAFNIYKEINPEIRSGIGTYVGKKYHTLFLPEAAKFYIQIPYNTRLSTENDPYTTVIRDIVEYSDSPLMVTVLPMMKGFPSSLYNSNFTISVYPLLKESGKLNLSLDIPDGLNQQDLTLSIDGKNIDYNASSAEIDLAAGSHSLNADIPGGLSLNRNFTIRSGETTQLRLEMTRLESYAAIDVPEGTSVFIDGEKIDFQPETRIKLEPGGHTVLFKIGDYKISKKFDISPGKDCKISLFLDIFIEEN